MHIDDKYPQIEQEYFNGLWSFCERGKTIIKVILIAFIVAVLICIGTTAFAATTAKVTRAELVNDDLVVWVEINDSGTLYASKYRFSNDEVASVSTISQFRTNLLNPKIVSDLLVYRNRQSALTAIQSNIGNSFAVQ